MRMSRSLPGLLSGPALRAPPAAGDLPNTQHCAGLQLLRYRLKVDRERGRIIVVSVIDNLTRGAAGQAVHNFNLMMGFPETQGLDLVPLAP